MYPSDHIFQQPSCHLHGKHLVSRNFFSFRSHFSVMLPTLRLCPLYCMYTSLIIAIYILWGRSDLPCCFQIVLSWLSKLSYFGSSSILQKGPAHLIRLLLLKFWQASGVCSCVMSPNCSVGSPHAYYLVLMVSPDSPTVEVEDRDLVKESIYNQKKDRRTGAGSPHHFAGRRRTRSRWASRNRSGPPLVRWWCCGPWHKCERGWNWNRTAEPAKGHGTLGSESAVNCGRRTIHVGWSGLGRGHWSIEEHRPMLLHSATDCM